MIQAKTIVVNKGFNGWDAKSDFTGGWCPTAWTNQAPFETVKQGLESINPGYTVEQYRVEHSDCRF
jgi:hypothetical protein